MGEIIRVWLRFEEDFMDIIACVICFIIGEFCGVLTVSLCIAGRSSNDDEEK